MRTKSAVILSAMGVSALAKEFLMEMYPVDNSSQPVEQLGDIQYKCQYQAGLNFYDLQPLAIYQRSYNFSLGGNLVMYLSFCNDLPEYLWCNPEDSTMAVLRDGDTGGCVRLSGPDPTNDAAFSVLNETINDGLRITYSGGDANYSFALNIPCNHSTPFNALPFFFDYNYTTNQTVMVGAFESQFGCQYDQLS
jgi:hypothetical protein